MRPFVLIPIGCILLGTAVSVLAGESQRVLAIRGARVLPVTSTPIENGTVLVENGRIRAVGLTAVVPIPDGAVIVEAKGQVLIPGLVDTHSHLGVYSRPGGPANKDGNESTGPVQPLVRAIDSIYPADPGFRMALAGGITTANVMPGSGNVLGGQTAYIKLRGATVEQMLIDLGAHQGGLKMANGENPKRNYGSRQKAPLTRMKVMALQREIFTKAADYRKKWSAYRQRLAEGAAGPDEAPQRDITLEPLVEVLEGTRTVHFHTHRADDISSAMRLAEEFGFELVLHHVTEAFEMTDEIARSGHGVSLILLDAPGGKHEATRLRLDNPAICQTAGIKVALHSDDPITESRLFLRTGALAVRGGLGEDDTLAALTIHGAEMLHLEDRVGSIEVGKDADLVLLSGKPFSTYTLVLKTWIEGELVFDRSQDLRFATGGYGVADRIPMLEVTRSLGAAPAIDPSIRRGKLGDGRFAVRAGRVHTSAGPPIESGIVVVENGKIQAIGKANDIEPAADMPIISAAVVTPGLIDAHSSVGLSGIYNVRADQDQDELVSPNQSSLRVLDGFNPREPLLDHLLRHGVTIIQCMPGPGNPIAGQGGIFRTHGRTAQTMRIKFPSAMLFNLGEGPKSTYGKRHETPSTRMGTAALIRAALAESLHPKPGPNGKQPVPDLGRNALKLALDGKIKAVFSAWREDDIATALRIGKEFNLEIVISQATDAYLMTETLQEAKRPILLGPLMQRNNRNQTANACLESAAILANALVPYCITSGFEGYVPKTRVILFEAAVAAANGLGRRRALESITIDPARILGLDDRFGSLEPGKTADLVLFDGDPLEYTTHVQRVFLAGDQVYTREGVE